MKSLIALLACASLAAAPRAWADSYYASFNNGGVFSIGRYPLQPNAFGQAIGSSSSVSPHDLDVAGNQLYWLDGNSILSANLDGSSLTTFQTFGIAPTSLEVQITPVPEPESYVILLAGLGLVRFFRRPR